MNQTQETQLAQSRNQQTQKLVIPTETSKKLAYIDVLMWGVASTLLIIVMLKVPDVALYCQNMLTTFATVYVSLRLGYTAKAGVENYKKISSNLSSQQSVSVITDETTNG